MKQLLQRYASPVAAGLAGGIVTLTLAFAWPSFGLPVQPEVLPDETREGVVAMLPGPGAGPSAGLSAGPGAGPGAGPSADAAEPTRLPGEHFVRTHLLNADGTIRTTLSPLIEPDDDLAWGEEALSESLGLMLAYAFAAGDEELFAGQVQALESLFWRDGWIPWKLGSDGTPATSNASIDDLRIARALYDAAAAWDEPRYAELADAIGASLGKRQLAADADRPYILDYYHWETPWPNPVITLSYIDLVTIEALADRDLIPAATAAASRQLLSELPQRNGWFPFAYRSHRDTYIFHDNVHLIDQFYVAYHREQAGLPSPEFLQRVKDTFYRDKKLYGRYAIESGKPAVTYESPAVYGLAIMYALEAGEYEWATDLHARLVRLQTLHDRRGFYGGFMAWDDTHSFDNLIPLLAERKFRDAKPAP